MRTAASIALRAIDQTTIGALEAISVLTYEVAESGKWSAQTRRMFAVLAEHILSNLDTSKQGGNNGVSQEDFPISPTPESEKE